MEDLQTITRVSRDFNISTRTLRYYEQLGLMRSVKMDGYSYRTYDVQSLIRLEQIILLRKLRISLKDIKVILEEKESQIALEVFKAKINELNDEITALSIIRNILEEFITRVKGNSIITINQRLLSDESLLKIIDSLRMTKINFKEDVKMDDLIKSNEKLSKLSDVRIVYLPPAAVASSQFYCEDPEMHAGMQIDKFVRESKLIELKPGLRHFGFNNPNCSPDTPEGMPDHGYEMWVTIPEDFDVPEPLKKKSFPGGLYAAHMIKMGDFHEWEWLIKWVENSEIYEPDWGDPVCMGGLLEEQLNYFHNVQDINFNNDTMQLDLLMPIKLREKK